MRNIGIAKDHIVSDGITWVKAQTNEKKSDSQILHMVESNITENVNLATSNVEPKEIPHSSKEEIARLEVSIQTQDKDFGIAKGMPSSDLPSQITYDIINRVVGFKLFFPLNIEGSLWGSIRMGV